MAVDTASISTLMPQATRDFDRFGAATENAAQRGTRSLSQLSVGLRDIVVGSAGLTVISSAIRGITDALTSLPRAGFNFSKDIEVSEMGMAGILGSMTAINGQQTTFQQGLSISTDIIRKLNDDALRTAATSQELVSTFQALLAPGLSARMTLDQVRELTVVGTNAVKSMGLAGAQVVQELRDLVAGGITAAGSSLATALGLKDEDIAKARASSEGLFAFLMARLQGFKASSDAFSGTLKGSLDQLSEGATRAAAEGMKPLIAGIKEAVDQGSKLFLTLDQAGNAQLNPQTVAGIRSFAQGAATALEVSRNLVTNIFEHRDAIMTLGKAYLALRIGQWATQAIASMQAYGASIVQTQATKAQADRLAAAEADAALVASVRAVAAAEQRAVALLAEAQAQQVATQSEVAGTTAKVAGMTATVEAIAMSRAEVLAKMDIARLTMAAAEAQIQGMRTTIAQTEATILASRAAGAQSYALAMLREATANQALAQSVLAEATTTLTATQLRHSALMSELALLGRQQASVTAAMTAATEAQAIAINAAAAAAARLQAAQAGGVATAAGAAAASTALATAQTGASLATRALGVASAALGGPLGVGIAVVTGLAMWLWTLKSNADQATKSLQAVELVRNALATGADVRPKYIQSLQQDLEAAKDELDALELRRGNIASNETAQTRYRTSLEAANKKVAEAADLLAKAQASAEGANKGTGQLTLTLAGTEQAWRKANAEVKTASAIQDEYKQKLQASRSAFAQYKEMLEKTAGPDAVSTATKRQAENEKALAAERDKQLKALNAEGARTTGQGVDAQVEALKRGYRVMALQTTDGIDAIDSLRQQDLISEYTAIQRKRDLQLEDLRNQETALARELALVKTKKDSLKEQQALQGEIRQVQQEASNVQAKAGRDLVELLVQPQLELLKSTRQGTQAIYDQASTLEAQNAVHGRAKTAINDLTIAQLEKTRSDLEATDNVIPGYVEALDKRIAAEKRLRAAVAQDEGLQIVDKIREKQREDAQKSADGISDVFRQGFANSFLDSGNALSSFAKSLKTTVVTSLANAFYDATLKKAVDGFSNWLMLSIQSAMAGSAASSASGGVLKSIVGGISGGLSGGTAATVANAIGGSDTLGTMIDLMGLTSGVKSAKGNVFSAASGLQEHVNTVVDRPTLFRYAKGGAFGEMGEAGTEGIFPLKRDSQGRLGVIASGGGGSSGSMVFAPVNHFNIDSRSDRAALVQDMVEITQKSAESQMTYLERMKVLPTT